MSTTPRLATPKLALVAVVLLVVGLVAGFFVGQGAVPTVTVTVTAPGVGVTATVTVPVTVTVPAPVPTEVYRFRMATFYLAGDPAFEIVTTFARLVEEMSGGRIKIEVFQAGELGFPVTEIVDATARGVVEIAIFYTSYLAAQDPIFALAGAKTGPLSDPWELLEYVRAVEDLVNATFRKWGVVYVGPMIYGEPEIAVFRVPIARLDDVKGKIMRASGLSAVFWSRLGAQTVMMPAGELYTALQLGTVDGLEWTDFVANYRLGFHEVAKYVIAPTRGYNLHSEAAVHAFLIVNPDVWAKLPEELKTIIRTACYATYWYSAELVTKLNIEYRQKWLQAGATIIELPEEDLKRIIDVGVELHVEYAKMSPEAREYVLRVLRVWKELGYYEWANALEKALEAASLLK
ncbi:MAG: TRAP transporter substrate-binding protein DctP [Sulfolobales archaeon]